MEYPRVSERWIPDPRSLVKAENPRSLVRTENNEHISVNPRAQVWSPIPEKDESIAVDPRMKVWKPEKEEHIALNPKTQVLMCTLCNVDFTSVALRLDHMKGKRHAKNIAKLLREPNTVIKKPLKKKPQAEEGQFGKCEMCNVFYRSPNEAVTHLFSETHKAKQEALHAEQEAIKLRAKKIEETAKLHKKIVEMTKKLKAKRAPDLNDDGIKTSGGGDPTTATSTSTSSSSTCPSPTGSISLNPPPPIPTKHRSARWARFYASTPAVKTQDRFTPFLPAFAKVETDETEEDEGKPNIETTSIKNHSDTNTNSHPAVPAKKVESEKKAIAPVTKVTSPVKEKVSCDKKVTLPVKKVTLPVKEVTLPGKEVTSPASLDRENQTRKSPTQLKKPPEEEATTDARWANFYAPNPLPSLEETTPPPVQKPVPQTNKPSSSKPQPASSTLNGESKSETTKKPPDEQLPKVPTQKLKRPKFCVHCGKKVPNQVVKFCGGCGRRIVGRVLAPAELLKRAVG